MSDHREWERKKRTKTVPKERERKGNRMDERERKSVEKW